MGAEDHTNDPLATKSDAERRHLAWQAAARRGDAIWMIPALVSLGVAIAIYLFGTQSMRLMSLVMGTGAANATPPPAGAAQPALPPWLHTVVLVTALGAAVLAWVVCRRRMLVATMRRLLNKTACPFCDFNIIGLRPQGSFVTCPECGERFDLYAHGLKPTDLQPEGERNKPFPGAGKYGAYRVPAAKK